ncbi:MAG: hypothetical protein ACYCTB_11460 [bacterium]
MNEESKAEKERKIFERFSKHYPSEIIGIESQSPPNPDIKCKLSNNTYITFELTEIIAENLAETIDKITKINYPDLLQSQKPEDIKLINNYYKNCQIGIGYDSNNNKNMKGAFPVIIELLKCIGTNRPKIKKDGPDRFDFSLLKNISLTKYWALKSSFVLKNLELLFRSLQQELFRNIADNEEEYIFKLKVSEYKQTLDRKNIIKSIVIHHSVNSPPESDFYTQTEGVWLNEIKKKETDPLQLNNAKPQINNFIIRNIEKKFNKSYRIDPNDQKPELLCYFELQPEGPFIQEVYEYIKDNISMSSFSRCWIYSRRGDKILSVYPDS